MAERPKPVEDNAQGRCVERLEQVPHHLPDGVRYPELFSSELRVGWNTTLSFCYSIHHQHKRHAPGVSLGERTSRNRSLARLKC